jgi:hypothetical protein
MKAYKRDGDLYNLYDERGHLVQFVNIRFKMVRKWNGYDKGHNLEHHLNVSKMREIKLKTYYKIAAMFTNT